MSAAAEVKVLSERAADACGALQGAADIIRRHLGAQGVADSLLKYSEDLLAAIIALDSAQRSAA